MPLAIERSSLYRPSGVRRINLRSKLALLFIVTVHIMNTERYSEALHMYTNITESN